ncbi:MAG: hypothetical protein U5L45_06360 [Saprospiraceae bacterium]|nr:hypothetical protein [Saprospiraceae bacterium]
MVHFSGKARKMNHFLLFLQAKRAIVYRNFEISYPLSIFAFFTHQRLQNRVIL